MRTTSRKMLEIIEGINQNRIMDKNLPMKISYALTKNVSAIQTSIKDYDGLRMKLVEKYAEKDEEGKVKVENGRFIINPENKAFYEEIEELLDIETEVDIYMVDESEIEKCDLPKYESLTPRELQALDFMFE